MPDYDPGMEALVTEMLRILAPDVEADALGYIEQLRAVQTALVDLLTGKTVVASSRAQPGEGLVLTRRAGRALAPGPGEARREGRRWGVRRRGSDSAAFGLCRRGIVAVDEQHRAGARA